MDNSQFKQLFGGDARRLEVVKAIAEELSIHVIEHLDRCTKTCVNCANWQQGAPGKPIERCRLNGMRPPARIIAFGCELYEDDIPF